MQLRFYARETDKVTEPDFRPFVGQPPRYVGRSFVPGDGVNPATHPAAKEPAVYDVGTLAGQRCAKECRRGSLWPADKETAAFCGVPFVEVEHVNGSWVRVKAAPAGPGKKGDK